MQTDELIALLAKAPRRPALSWARALAGLVVAIMTVTVLVLGLRPDIARPPAAMAYKSVLLVAVLASAGLMLARAARPLAPRHANRLPVLAVAALIAVSLGWEWASMPLSSILRGFWMPNFPFCLGAVTLYGTAAGAALTALMRTYAPADAKRAATAIGLAAAAAGAVGYSIHCPIDSPTFVVVAYGLPIGWITAIGRLVLARRLTW